MRSLHPVFRDIIAAHFPALASVDTHPKGGDAKQAPAPLSGAVPNESEGDAQQPLPTERGPERDNRSGKINGD